MSSRTAKICSAALLSGLMALAALNGIRAETPKPVIAGDGIVKVKSAYPVDETIVRLKKDIADKGIMFFAAVDQSKLAAPNATPLATAIVMRTSTARSRTTTS